MKFQVYKENDSQLLFNNPANLHTPSKQSLKILGLCRCKKNLETNTTNVTLQASQ